MKLVQIVPQLPPTFDGLGDYGLNLARQFRLRDRLDTHFLVGAPNWSGDGTLGFAATAVPRRDRRALLDLLAALAPTAVLLHYVSYGYAKRGCPFWLVDALEATSLPLVTMYHEVAGGSRYPWTSSFWTGAMQRRLAARLAARSDRCLTNKPLFARVIADLCPQQQNLPVLPVFSNIGEPETVRPLAERRRQLVVFGSRGNRQRVYERARPALERACWELQIAEVTDIGPPLDNIPGRIASAPVIAKGKCPPEQVAELLGDAIAGFFHYPLDFLVRSTIFAAYCAYGTVPVGVDSSTRWGKDDDGLEPGQQFWLADRDPLDDPQVIADRARQWYLRHDLSTQTRQFSAALQAAAERSPRAR